jgi:hypothetical protein
MPDERNQVAAIASVTGWGQERNEPTGSTDARQILTPAGQLQRRWLAMPAIRISLNAD